MYPYNIPATKPVSLNIQRAATLVLSPAQICRLWRADAKDACREKSVNRNAPSPNCNKALMSL
ncbi:hypothetical protein GCM10017655_19010 [Pseudomonas turukhanskensis]|uniref:Uncharacterized protein n=1 Tax=Pseudomonas turukhanskensis TaxID=1806536 RepID=A0A9W6NEM2_9PSED|nr:hypothetical protein GCM10017655_19010 [Pseudomonas turukhanskensis]